MQFKSRMMKKQEPRRGKRGSRLLRLQIFHHKAETRKTKGIKCVTINRRIFVKKQRG